jgi:hypothetical protein
MLKDEQSNCENKNKILRIKQYKNEKSINLHFFIAFFLFNQNRNIMLYLNFSFYYFIFDKK